LKTSESKSFKIPDQARDDELLVVTFDESTVWLSLDQMSTGGTGLGVPLFAFCKKWYTKPRPSCTNLGHLVCQVLERQVQGRPQDACPESHIRPSALLRWYTVQEDWRLCMPELSRFYNIVIKLLFSDTGQHNKPHIHALYNEFEASIGIDGELLAGSLPVKQLRLVLAWMAIHEDELYAAWNKAVRNEPFDKIEPLR